MRPRRRILHATAIAAAAATLAAGVWVRSATVPRFADVRAGYGGSEATLLDRNGIPLQTLRLDQAVRQLDWVPLGNVSAAFVNTVMRAEDRRFRRHPGVDPLAIAAAMRDNLTRPKARGASTITMQLATMLAAGSGAPAGTWRTKLAQARSALAIEARWSKDEILEAYVNLAPFRGELRGIGAAAAALVGKGPAGLDGAEAAVLVAMLPAPGASAARVARRACAIVDRTASTDAAACDRTALIAAALPRRHVLPSKHDDAPHLARHLLRMPGERVRSTLDAATQRFANEALREQLRSLAGHNVEDGAIVVLDNASGDVLAWVGSSGALSDAPHVDGVRALRQPGSTLKPFLYALALETGWLTAASILDDTPLAIATPGGLYLPQNYDRDFRGRVSLRTALAGSLNVPAVRTLTLVGLPRFHELLRALGFASLDRAAEHYGYGLALGGAEVDLLTLVNAYRALANGGRLSPARTRPDDPVPASVQVVDPRAAFVIGDILADRGARAGTFGVASPLDTRVRAAVKTGTSKAMRDNWALGWTDRVTVGVWVGNFSGAPMIDVSGVTGAAPILRNLIDRLHDGSEDPIATPPTGLVQATTSFGDVAEGTRTEWFLAGTEMKEVSIAPPPRSARIVAPATGAIVAVDPDIPPSRQRLRVDVRGSAAAEGGATCIELDGQRSSACSSRSVYLLTLPDPGFHQLRLRDSHGAILHEVAFEVRGLPRPALQATHLRQ